MTETNDALHAAIMNLPCKPPALANGSEVWAYQYGHRDARHAAAELVSASLAVPPEAPREPVAWRFTHNRGNGKTAYTYHDTTPENNWLTAYRDTCLEITPLSVALPVAAPMKEEWLKEAERLADVYATDACRASEHSYGMATIPARAAILSHLRTAPLEQRELSDEQTRCAELLESLCCWLLHRFGANSPEANEAQFRLKVARALLAASAAPQQQPEQPNTELPHLAQVSGETSTARDAAHTHIVPTDGRDFDWDSLRPIDHERWDVDAPWRWVEITLPKGSPA